MHIFTALHLITTERIVTFVLLRKACGIVERFESKLDLDLNLSSNMRSGRIAYRLRVWRSGAKPSIYESQFSICQVDGIDTASVFSTQNKSP